MLQVPHLEEDNNTGGREVASKAGNHAPGRGVPAVSAPFVTSQRADSQSCGLQHTLTAKWKEAEGFANFASRGTFTIGKSRPCH